MKVLALASSFFRRLLIPILSGVFALLELPAQSQSGFPYRQIGPGDIRTGAERTEVYFPLLEGQRIAVAANQTSLIDEIHLVDSLLGAGHQVVKVFAPEHGFRGEAGAGEEIQDGRDTLTGLPVVSLYGKKKKPGPEDLEDIDLLIFDIQDVGARFYTYISTLTYIMEACAALHIPVIILDRPNPNGHYVDGPILKPAFTSFVGLHPVPLVHGMTIGEYAAMVNGEQWLKDSLHCDMRIVRVSGYTHRDMYQLLVRPSPNLPNMSSVYLYPSLALFEGTEVSVGRGTDYPFQVFGHPELKDASYTFVPEKRLGAAPNPPQEGKLCHGYDLRDFGYRFIRNYRSIYLYWLIETYRDLGGNPAFFTPFFDKLAGTDELRQQIISGWNEGQIRESWQPGLTQFKQIRKKYLLYPDFE